MPPSQGPVLLLLQHQPFLQLVMTPLCHEQVLQRGLLAATSGDLWQALFLEKFLVQTQTVIELFNWTV